MPKISNGSSFFRPSRRGFLRRAWQGLLAAGGLLAADGLLRFFSYQTGPSRPTKFELGLVEDYPLDSVTPIPAAAAVLRRTTAGFIALSAVCPHLGCQVTPSPDGFVCPCHDSLFDAAGALQRGPAQQSLQKLRLEETAERQLILYLEGNF